MLIVLQLRVEKEQKNFNSFIGQNSIVLYLPLWWIFNSLLIKLPSILLPDCFHIKFVIKGKDYIYVCTRTNVCEWTVCAVLKNLYYQFSEKLM